MVNIKQVGYFVAVFETKSFTAAAHRRNVTVQAIFMPRLAPPSKHIARLKTLTRLDAT